MAKNLVIVESPAKAKTIEGYLGKDFLVKSSYGHVRDLPKKGLSINLEKNFAPEYVVSDDKKKLVAELKKLAKSSECIWLASDEDREGEAIAWHLLHSLGLDNNKTKRIVFNEITEKAINNAIDNPRSINENLVNAQQARRVLDRLVGYELSPVLWKKVKPNTSAGRVQSVAVRLIVEKERERQNFKIENYFRVVGMFQQQKSKSQPFSAYLSKRLKSKSEAEKLLNACINFSFTVAGTQKKPAKKSPAAPFTTSTLQQEAARKLGYSVSRTMQVAQKLYEAGKITYMRTDSVHLSEYALNSAQKTIGKMYGNNYHKLRQYKHKSKGAQEAHECVRPVNFSTVTVGMGDGEEKLYNLIWKRAIASQMSDAQLEKTTITINSPDSDLKFLAKGEMIKFDGFLKVYLEGTDEETADDTATEGLLPKVEKNETLDAKSITATERFTQPPARYTEASLVKKLEELGIGRPSTYAPTISTIQKRGYVDKDEKIGTERSYLILKLNNEKIDEAKHTEVTGADKGKLSPTDIGIVVNDFLVQHFKNILDYNFTAKVEEDFDKIAAGEKKWHKMIELFYRPFHKSVESTETIAGKEKGEHFLGKDPKTNRNVYARIGRFGPMVQIGEAEEEEKPKFASLQKGQSITNITLEEALKLFDLPKDIGEYEDQTVTLGVGRFGPYVRHNNKFVSIPKNEDIANVTLERAKELIEAKRETERNRIINRFDSHNPVVEVLNGRWGPYISIGKKNIRIPKDKDPKKLTLEDCLELSKQPKNDKPKGKARSKKQKSKT